MPGLVVVPKSAEPAEGQLPGVVARISAEKGMIVVRLSPLGAAWTPELALACGGALVWQFGQPPPQAQAAASDERGGVRRHDWAGARADAGPIRCCERAN